MRSATTIILCLAAGLAAACGSDEEGAPIPAESATAPVGFATPRPAISGAEP